MAKTKVGVLISGRGSNLQALIDACQDEAFPAEISLVISNKAGAKGLDKARNADIDTDFIDHTLFEEREDFERKLDERLKDAGVKAIFGPGTNIPEAAASILMLVREARS